MRAVVYDRYGPPEVLRLAEVDRPWPRDDEVLVRVRATTVNRTDCGFRDPRPFIVRCFSGLWRPRRRILGSEFAGEVEAVGAAVTQFARGDPVFGVNADRFGAHAEFVCVREGAPIATLPSGMTFDEAAAVCDGVILALTCLRWARLEREQRILVYGASGSIGIAAVQLAKHLGARVTAVCGPDGVEAVSSFAPDRVIDHARKDFTAIGETFDVVFDAVGKTSFRRCHRLVKRGGAFVETDLGFMWQNPILSLLTWRIAPKRVLMPLAGSDALRRNRAKNWQRRAHARRVTVAVRCRSPGPRASCFRVARRAPGESSRAEIGPAPATFVTRCTEF